MVIAYAKVSGFTYNGSGGNAAGVILPIEATRVCEDARVRVAKDIGFSETVFVDEIVETERGLRIKLNYYTPEARVDVCGHATIACLGYLFEGGLLSGGKEGGKEGGAEGELELVCGRVKFEFVEGQVFMQQLPVTVDNELESRSLIALRECLNISEEDLDVSVFEPCVASTGLRDVQVCLKSEECLDGLAPDFVKMTALSETLDVVGVHVSVLCGEGRVKVRNFAPRYAIDEESATGTSNCALAGVLGKRGGMEWGGVKTFEQGDGMGEPSRITVRLGGSESEPAWVGGKWKVVENNSVLI